VRDKHVKTFASPELAKGLFSLYLGPKVRVAVRVCVYRLGGASRPAGRAVFHRTSGRLMDHHRVQASLLTPTQRMLAQAISPEAKKGFATLAPELLK